MIWFEFVKFRLEYTTCQNKNNNRGLGGGGSTISSFPISSQKYTLGTNGHIVNVHLVETNSHHGGCDTEGGEYDEGDDPFPQHRLPVNATARVYVNVEITHDDTPPRRADARVLFLVVVHKILFLIPPRQRPYIIRHDMRTYAIFSAPTTTKYNT